MYGNVPTQTAQLYKSLKIKKSSAILDEVESSCFFRGVESGKFLKGDYYLFHQMFSLKESTAVWCKKKTPKNNNTCTIKNNNNNTLLDKSLTVVLWHIKCSVACPLRHVSPPPSKFQLPNFMAPKYVPSPSRSSIQALDTLTNKVSPFSSRTPRPCCAQYML